MSAFLFIVRFSHGFHCVVSGYCWQFLMQPRSDVRSATTPWQKCPHLREIPEKGGRMGRAKLFPAMVSATFFCTIFRHRLVLMDAVIKVTVTGAPALGKSWQGLCHEEGVVTLNDASKK